MTPAARHIAVVGAGWAGLAAATTLQQAGHEVTVFESSHEVGGRARRVAPPSPANDGKAHFTAPLDNGQHLMLGAYAQTLALMRSLGVDANTALLRTPLQLLSADGSFKLRAPELPAPLHTMAALLTARGLAWRDKWAAVSLMRSLRSAAFRTPAGATVADLLEAARQPASLIRSLWQPLCLAALNTPVQQACAQIFANVLRDSLDRSRADSDLLLPRVDLSALWPLAAASHCWMRRGHSVRTLAPADDGIAVDGEHFDSAVLAVPPYAAARLLPDILQSRHLRENLQAFRYIPIATLTVRLAAPYRLPQPMMMLFDDLAQGHDGQWVFDRGALLGLDAAHGELAIVVSAAELLGERARTQIILDLTRQLAEQLARNPKRLAPLPEVVAAELIVEKRATFAATPGLQRPGNGTPWPSLMLAGDWTDTGYPATLEGAVRSGLGAAARLIKQYEKRGR